MLEGGISTAGHIHIYPKVRSSKTCGRLTKGQDWTIPFNVRRILRRHSGTSSSDELMSSCAASHTSWRASTADWKYVNFKQISRQNCYLDYKYVISYLSFYIYLHNLSNHFNVQINIGTHLYLLCVGFKGRWCWAPWRWRCWGKYILFLLLCRPAWSFGRLVWRQPVKRLVALLTENPNTFCHRKRHWIFS